MHGSSAVLRELLFNNLINAIVSGSIMLFCTKGVVTGALRYGFNPDNIAPIVVTSLGDTITIPCIVAIVTLLLAWTPPFVQQIVVAMLAMFALALLFSQRHRASMFFRIAKQRIPVLTIW